MNNRVIIVLLKSEILKLTVNDILSRSPKTINRHDLNEACLFF